MPNKRGYRDVFGENRIERARRMYDSAPDHHVIRVLPRFDLWIIRSQRRPGIYYRVQPVIRACDCADFRLNGVVGKPLFVCKHLILVQLVQRGGRLLRIRGRAGFFLAVPSDMDAMRVPYGHTDHHPMDAHRYGVRSLGAHHAFVVHTETGAPFCGHAHDIEDLAAWSEMPEADERPCPMCIATTMNLLVVGADAGAGAGQSPTGGGGGGRAAQDREIVYAKSVRERLDRAKNSEFRMRVYGQDRCDETIVRNIGVATLASYQKIVEWFAEDSVASGIATSHSVLFYHDVGSGKTSSLWTALGRMWKTEHGRHRTKYFFVTKQSLAAPMQPAEDVWAFYKAAGRGSHSEVRRTIREKEGNRQIYEDWTEFLPAPVGTEGKARKRILSYEELANACLGGNDIGRAMWGVEFTYSETDDPMRKRIREKNALTPAEFLTVVRATPSVFSTQRKAFKKRVLATPGKTDADANELAHDLDTLIAKAKARNENRLENSNILSRNETGWQLKKRPKGWKSKVAKYNAEIKPLLERVAPYLGPIDPLHNATIAIDEADLLFSSRSEIEAGKVELIERAIFHSYETSGTEAVRVILGTATPAHTSVRDSFRLLNVLLRDKDLRVSGVGSGGEEGEEQFVGERTVDDLAGPNGDFNTPFMWRYMNKVKDALSRVNVTRDFDHFPHRLRRVVDVQPADANRVADYDREMRRAFAAKEPKPGESEPELPGLSEAERSLARRANRLRGRLNLLIESGATMPLPYRLGHPKYDREAFAAHVVAGYGPKLVALLQKIREIDEAADPTLPPPKHVVLTSTSGPFGAPLIAAALEVAGYLWRPFRRTRNGRSVNVSLAPGTQRPPVGVSGSDESALPAVSARYADRSRFVVLDPRLLDFAAEHPTDGSAIFAQSRPARATQYENAEYKFVARRDLADALGIEVPRATTGSEPSEEVQTKRALFDMLAGKNLYRKPGLWNPEVEGETPFSITLDNVYTESIPGDDAKSVAQLLDELLPAGTPPHANLTIEDLRDRNLVQWAPVLGETQKREAVKLLKKLFNSRADNMQGEVARIVVVAPELTTGTSLFEVEHLHLFDALEEMEDGAKDAEPRTRDRIQQEGRAWRRCGHKTLRQLHNAETTLNIYEYRMDPESGVVVDADDALPGIRALREPGVTVERDEDSSLGQWSYDELAQALRTDPDDRAALVAIDDFLNLAAFDKNQNDPLETRTPIYTGYTLTNGARPLYRSYDGQLVAVDGEPIDSIAAFGDSLFDLWVERRVMWDMHAGTWVGVADREQGAIEDAMADDLERQLEGLMRAARRVGATEPGTEDLAPISRDLVHDLRTLRAEIADARRQGRDVSDLRARAAAIASDLRDGPPEESGVGAGRMLWRDRALLYRSTMTNLPQKRDGSQAVAPLGVRRPSGWYGDVSEAVGRVGEEVGILLRNRRIRDLWFASHVSDTLQSNIFVELGQARQRMRYEPLLSESGDAAQYIERAFGKELAVSVMRDSARLKSVLNVASWLTIENLRFDVGFFHAFLGINLDKVLEAIRSVGDAPGQTQRERQLAVMATLSTEDGDGMWKHVSIAARILFGTEHAARSLRAIGAALVGWYAGHLGWRDRETAHVAVTDSEARGALADPGPEPRRIDAFFTAAAQVFAYFRDSRRPAPTRFYSNVRIMASEVTVAPETLAAYFIDAVVDAPVMWSDDVAVLRGRARPRAVDALIAVLGDAASKATGDIACDLEKRSSDKFNELRNAGRVRATVQTAAEALYDSVGDWKRAREIVVRAQEVTRYDTYTEVVDNTLAPFVGADIGTSILMTTQELKGPGKTRLFYLNKAEPDTPVYIPIDPGAKWSSTMLQWLVAGSVSIVNVTAHEKLIKMKGGESVVMRSTKDILNDLVGSKQGLAGGENAAPFLLNDLPPESALSRANLKARLLIRSADFFDVADLGARTGDENAPLLSAIQLAGNRWNHISSFCDSMAQVLYGMRKSQAMQLVLSSPDRAKAAASVDVGSDDRIAEGIKYQFGRPPAWFKEAKINGYAALMTHYDTWTKRTTALVWALRGISVERTNAERVRAAEPSIVQLAALSAEIADIKQRRKAEDVPAVVKDRLKQQLSDAKQKRRDERDRLADVPRIIAVATTPGMSVANDEANDDTDATTRAFFEQEMLRRKSVREMRKIAAAAQALDAADAEARQRAMRAETGSKATRAARNQIIATEEIADLFGDDAENDGDDAYSPDAARTSRASRKVMTIPELRAEVERLYMRLEKRQKKNPNYVGTDSFLKIAARIVSLDMKIANAESVSRVDREEAMGTARDAADIRSTTPDVNPFLLLDSPFDGKSESVTSLRSFRAAPLHIAEPEHLRGEVVPIQVAKRMVWRVTAPGRLVLAHGFALLPSGKMLDPACEGDPIIAGYF